MNTPSSFCLCGLYLSIFTILEIEREVLEICINPSKYDNNQPIRSERIMKNDEKSDFFNIFCKFFKHLT